MGAVPCSLDGAMCEKCDEIDKTILRYRRIQQRILEPTAIEGAQKLIDEMEADKAACHLE